MLLGTGDVFFIGSISLDLEVGSMGLPNFGKVGFFAIGAYASTLLYSEWGVPFPIAVVIALLLSAFVGYFISIPTVKLRADYFAIMTIAGGEIIRLALAYEKRWLYPGNRLEAMVEVNFYLAGLLGLLWQTLS